MFCVHIGIVEAKSKVNITIIITMGITINSITLHVTDMSAYTLRRGLLHGGKTSKTTKYEIIR